ncbi:MAG: tripartite tricarboxylate transporter TctB family protein [Usitatibacter sp.]
MQDGLEDRAVGSVRMWETIVAVGFLIFGAVVVWESRRLGSEWASDGPQAGYFPFYIGVIICISAVVNLITALNAGPSGRQPFVYRKQIRMVLTVMIPCAIYVALIANPVYSLGIYEASALFIAIFMRYLGKYGWGSVVGVSLGTMLVFFIMFEIWFQVPLPKGPIEALFGFS